MQLTDGQKGAIVVGVFVGLVAGILLIAPYLSSNRHEELINPAQKFAGVMSAIQDAILQ